jgi:hypothetical protein
MGKAIWNIYFCVLLTSLCLIATQATSATQLSVSKVFGFVVGIAGFDGKFDPADVARKCAELKALPAPPSKQQNIEQCRKIGGIPQDGTGKIIKWWDLPQMGGNDCIICWSQKDLNDPNVRRLVEPACPEANTEMIK